MGVMDNNIDNPIKKITYHFSIPFFFLRDVVIYGFTNIIGRFINYLFVPLYTRVMSPHDYGDIITFYSVMSFAYVVAIFSMESSFLNYSNEYDEKKVFSTTYFVVIVFSVIVGVGGGLLLTSPLWNFNFLYSFLFFMILLMDGASYLPYAYLRKLKMSITFSLVKMAGITVNVFLTIIFYIVLRKQNPEYVFIANAGGSALSLLLLLPFILKRISIPDIHTKLAIRTIKYAFPLVVTALAGMINDNIDKILVSILHPGDEIEKMKATGIYGACYKISVIILIVTGAIRMAMEPIAYEYLGQKNKITSFRRISYASLYLVGAAALSTIIYLPYIKFFVAPSYYEGLRIVPVVSFAYLFYAIVYVNSFWYKIRGSTYWGSIIGITGAIITIILNVVLIPKMGYMGGAWATLITYITMSVLSFLLSIKYFPIHTTKSITMPVVSAFVIYLIWHSINKEFINTDWIKTILGTLLIFIYLITFFITGGNLREVRHEKI